MLLNIKIKAAFIKKTGIYEFSSIQWYYAYNERNPNANNNNYFKSSGVMYSY